METLLPVNGGHVKVLNVPYFIQSDTEWLCLVYSIKMVMDFYKNVHSKSEIRQRSPNTTRDELIGVTRTKLTTGTPISDDLVLSLNTKFPSLQFELKETNYSEIKQELDRHNPVIVMYDPTFLFNNEEGPGHSGVVIGMNKQLIVLNNPWYGPAFCVEKAAFTDAWELEYNRGMFIKPNSQQRIDTDASTVT